ncbi:MAG: DUF3786 domain-containing protein [Nitrososphaerota archaeon]|jgi:hypothetical protein|nr:DUF3786 domain-containing protein [Nitrososphaerota archaeon]
MSYGENSGCSKLIPSDRRIFVAWDYDKIMRKFSRDYVNCDENYVYLNFIYQPFKVDKKTGYVYKTVADNDEVECKNPLEIMSIMDMLCSEKPLQLSNVWCPISYFSKFSSIGEKAEKELYADFAEHFSGNATNIYNACSKLGGIDYTVNESADVSFKINIFDFFPAVFQFWNKDDDFPSQIKILWDKNTLDYILFETSYYVVACLLERIQSQIEK